MSIPNDTDTEQSRAVVDRWDANNGIALLGDHRDDLIHVIAIAIATREREVRAEEREACALIAENYGKGRIYTAADAGIRLGVKTQIAEAIRGKSD